MGAENSTEFSRAIVADDYEAVERLLSQENPNNVDVIGYTPLIYCSIKGFISTAHVLLENGADPNLMHRGITPLYMACRHGNTEIVHMLLEDPDIAVNKMLSTGSSALHIACVFGNAQCVDLLLNHKDIEINKQSEFGETPLHRAVRQKETEIVKLLLDQPEIDLYIEDAGGSNVFQLDSSGEILKLLKLKQKTTPEKGEIEKKRMELKKMTEEIKTMELQDIEKTISDTEEKLKDFKNELENLNEERKLVEEEIAEKEPILAQLREKRDNILRKYQHDEKKDES